MFWLDFKTNLFPVVKAFRKIYKKKQTKNKKVKYQQEIGKSQLRFQKVYIHEIVGSKIMLKKLPLYLQQQKSIKLSRNL